MVFSALSGPGHLHLTFSFSTSGHVKGKMHAWSLWEALWLTSSLLFSCTQSCKGLQDTYLWWWHASAQRNSTKFPFRLTLYPTANPLEPLHRAHYPDAHEGRPHHLFRATWAELAGMPGHSARSCPDRTLMVFVGDPATQKHVASLGPKKQKFVQAPISPGYIL